MAFGAAQHPLLQSWSFLLDCALFDEGSTTCTILHCEGGSVMVGKQRQATGKAQNAKGLVP